MADSKMSASSSSDSLYSMVDDRDLGGYKVVSSGRVPVVNDYLPPPKCVIFVNEDGPDELEIGEPGKDSLLEQEQNPGKETVPWSDLSCGGRLRRVCSAICRPLLVLLLLYFFVCSLDLLSSAFRLVAGKAAGHAFSSSVLLQSPVAGLMLGIVSTVLVQSSSTSTSIVVTMVSSGIMGVRPAIPIIMGANIGTSVTNTIVSLAQSSNRDQFELAFAGATVHDMFNWLAVIVFLPLEVASGALYHLTRLMVDNCEFHTTEGANRDLLKALTKPLTKLVVQLDKSVIEKLALGMTEYQNKTLLKQWCSYASVLVPVSDNLTESALNSTDVTVVNGSAYILDKEPVTQCSYLLRHIPLPDVFLGLLLLVASLCLLCGCLVLVVKILNQSLSGPIASAATRLINKDLPGRCACLTGYLAVGAGAGLTVAVQSSSVLTSTLTPLVGLGVVSLERMYPLTLGSNIGTTTTGLLAAAAASGDRLRPALQVALVHLFFNIAGILLFYPVPAMRWPLPLARLMGRTTAKYRWFAVLYLIGMFFILPGAMFGLSLAGPVWFGIVGGTFLALALMLLAANVLKKRFGEEKLPGCVWSALNCLPRAFYSLQPLDNVITRLTRCCCCGKKSAPAPPKSAPPPSIFDEMTEDQIREYESTVRSLEEVKVMLAGVRADDDDVKTTTLGATAGTDSGYVTQIHTPHLSTFPSKEDFSRM